MLLHCKKEFAILSKRRNIIIFLIFFLITLYCSNLGVVNYENILEKSDTFKEYEKTKAQKHVSYEYYGGYGIRIQFLPATLFVFFNKGNFCASESNITTLENNKIYSINEGRALFPTGNYNDLGGIVFLFSSFLMLFMGSSVFNNGALIQRVLRVSDVLFTALIRFIFLSIGFWVIFVENYLWVLFRDIPLTSKDFNIFLNFYLYFLVFAALFYSIGMLVGVISERGRKIVLMSIWLLFIFVLPDSAGSASKCA